MFFTGAALAFLGSLPSLVLLRYLDRRQPESWWYYLAVLLLATLFTTAAARCAALRMSWNSPR